LSNSLPQAKSAILDIPQTAVKLALLRKREVPHTAFRQRIEITPPATKID
jgi:hypothetical protein